MTASTAVKAKMTTGTIISLMAKSKMTSWLSRMTLYNSVLLNSISSCISIWGLKYTDIIETVQVQFLKRLLSLSRGTPGYLLRLETGLPALSFLVFKYALCWLLKLLSMNNSRFPKICYLRLLDLDRKNLSHYNYNWVTQVKKIFIQIGCEQEWSKLNASFLKANFQVYLEKYKQVLREADLLRLRDSRHSDLINQYTYTSGPKSYLTGRFPVFVAKTIAQLRMCNTKRISFFEWVPL